MGTKRLGTKPAAQSTSAWPQRMHNVHLGQAAARCLQSLHLSHHGMRRVRGTPSGLSHMLLADVAGIEGVARVSRNVHACVVRWPVA